MLKKILFLLTLSLVTLSLVTLAKAAITNSSRVIPYQGRLTDSSGNNVADSTYAMTFKIYTVSSGGSAAFTETFSAGNAVTVSSGLFSVLLGSLSANGVNLDFANPPYYLGITVASNSEMTPRIQIGFTALAHNSQYLDGTPLSSFQLNTGVLTGAAGTNTRLQATGTGTGSTGNGSIYFLNSSGTTKGRFDTLATDATGGTITHGGGYTIHTFTSSGTFTPSGAGNVEYLGVGGGGGGGSSAAGGGGAGGFLTGTGFAVTAQSYSITVGGGGSGGSSESAGSQGSSSIFASITATGGGAGGYGAVGGNGGSGGGGSGRGLITGNDPIGGTASSGQGSNGGNGHGDWNSSIYQSGGGGGGASSVGTAGSTAVGGNGGNGTASSISGSSITYAGGGGGTPIGGSNYGSGGSGGGGAGGSTGTNGTANTGGGGGASQTGNSGGNGGSGIVIIRYLTSSLAGYGTMYLGATNTSSADLAEYYVTGDKTMEAGDVVAIASNPNDQIPSSKGVLLKSNKAYDSKLVGVISTNPGVVLGSIDGDTGKRDKRQLALAGRVPVKLDPDSEPIEVGDFLTSSDKPGLAKKATESGYVIGKALENWSGQPTIEVFINLIYKQEKSEFEEMKRLICLDHPDADLCKKK